MRTKWFRRIASLLATALLLAFAGSSNIMAQRFQAVYGSAECVEAGRAGVVQLTIGGYAAAGESWFNPDGTCGPSHIYVIRTDASGALIWANVYVIGSSDSALDIVECNNGDLAVCGVVTDAAGCNPGRDAFLLRLDINGNVLAVRTYGTPCSDEIAWNLVEAQAGNGCTTNRGDLIAVGSTTWNAGVSPNGDIARDGYIFRTDANLNLIWGSHYGGPFSYDDYLYGVDECLVDPAGTGLIGDIVATGGTNTWGFGGYDMWILRVNGNNGSIGAAPQNGATYGGPQDDEGRAIIELRGATNPGDLAVAGISFSRPFPSTNSEVAMLQTRDNPCLFVADQYAGDNGTGADGGLDLKEDAFPSNANGDVIVTGFTVLGAPIGPPNAFLQKFVCGTMTLVGSARAYGGSRTDWGWSVNNCTGGGVGVTRGYVIAGFTQSPDLIGNDPQQLYLIKTDLGFNSACNEAKFDFKAVRANFFDECPRPCVEILNNNCRPEIWWQPLDPWYWLCYKFPKALDQGGNGNDGAGGGDGSGGAESGVDAMATLTFTEGSVSSYPNPITRGLPLNLRFTLAGSAQADVSVADVTGRIVYRETMSVNAGSELRTVATKGWAGGTYVVSVTIGGKSSTTKVVLTE